MQLSASLYSNDALPLQTLVQELDRHQVDFFHIDCPDRPAVFADVEAIRAISHTPIDLHLITPHPTPYLHTVERLGIEWVSYQYEDLRDPREIPGDVPWQQGLALTAQTPVEVFDQVADRCSFVLFMATIPGRSGGQFHVDTFRRIRAFRRRYPAVRVHVDGGVNAEVSFILRNMGVSAVVSGSYLLNGHSIGAAMLHLKASTRGSAYRVRDFMLSGDEVPVLAETTATFREVLLAIENHRQGLVIMTDDDGALAGIITNADVRRGLLRHFDRPGDIAVADLINRQPVYAQADDSVSDLLRIIRQTPFPVNYLPVVEANKRVCGLVTFFELVKGE
ncbi:MAG: hypothetical protein OHK0039_29730 [Bacteroidia bacterium]